VDAVLKPGTAHLVMPILNVSLVLLLCVLVASAVRWPDSPVVWHLAAMGGLASALLVLVNWFANEVTKAKKKQARD